LFLEREEAMCSYKSFLCKSVQYFLILLLFDIALTKSIFAMEQSAYAQASVPAKQKELGRVFKPVQQGANVNKSQASLPAQSKEPAKITKPAKPIESVEQEQEAPPVPVKPEELRSKPIKSAGATKPVEQEQKKQEKFVKQEESKQKSRQKR
jgi:hypothetical protein